MDIHGKEGHVRTNRRKPMTSKMRAEHSRLMMIALSMIGIIDSIYLTVDSFAKISPFCPAEGVIDCVKVTQSIYSHPYGIPVALLGLLWFTAMLGLGVLRLSFAPYLMLPLWLAGIIMVGYLIYVEVFLLHAICLYCTLAHTCTALMIIPIVRLTFSEE